MCTPTKLMLLCFYYGIEATVNSKCTHFDFVDNFDLDEEYYGSILHNFELDLDDLYNGIPYLLRSEKITNTHIRYILTT